MALLKNTSISFDPRNTDTVIGQEAYFQGTLTAKGSLKVDGRIDGSIVDAKLVTVGKAGKVKGDISCETCIICGEVRGNVLALEKVELTAESRLEGDITSPGVVIEEGAFFSGACSMENRAARAQNAEKAGK